ncbi:hypothetical protein BegalDRAFT_0373 [Beggiatoa alba B18LD]|uniref:CHAT domain-containing protein n=1 Tax=Beggiatoa alba B18LD TaxID=395493 RepID=I3CCF0_9GAMM|nr:tetratricopeptide repeat protein [Beggiatoa alba]EIJ41293.1 hypothetical protein BegalDRAFT_0373 [Beggiatoa alba B18LD]
MLKKLVFSWLLCLPVLAYSASPREAHQALYQEGRTAELAGDTETALARYQQALNLSRADWAEDSASLLQSMGDVYKAKARYAEAEAAYAESLAIREKVLGAEHGAVAVSLNNLAGVYYEFGRYTEAEALYKRALAIDEKDAGVDSAKVAIRLNNLAELYRNLGNFADAELLLQRALKIDKSVSGENSPRVAIRLNNLAELYRQKGDYAQAETLLLSALKIDEKAVQAKELAPVNLGIRYNNLGQLYRTIGDYQRAKPLYEKALAIWEKSLGKEHPIVGAGLNNLGWLAYNLKDYAQSEQLLKRALAIAQKVYKTEHPDIARNLNNLGLLYATQGQYTQAADYYAQAFIIWEKVYGKDHANVAITLTNQAKISLAQQDFNSAENKLQRALGIAFGSEQPLLLWKVLDTLSRVYNAEKQFDSAIFVGKQAVNTLQTLRVNLAKMDKELQRSFLTDKEDVYRHLADLLTNQGRLSEAQQVLMMLKEEEYFDFIRRDSNVTDVRRLQANYSEAEQPWVTRGNELNQQISNIAESIRTLRQKLQLSPEEQKRLVALQQESDEKFLELEQYLSEVKQSFARQEQRRQQAGERAEASTVCAGQNDFPQNQKALDSLVALQKTLRELSQDAVLINYLITRDKLRMILTTANEQLCRDAPISDAALNDTILKFRTALQDVRRPPLKLANDLYHVLIEPVADDLQRVGAKTLMLSLDGRLRYIPFSALYDGQEYLAEKYAISLLIEVGRDKITIQPHSEWSLAGLGLTKAVRNFNPLPAVEKELETIVKQKSGESGILPGIIRLNDKFTPQTLREVLHKTTYPVLHIASHFVFKTGTDQDSFLLMGDGSELTLADIRNSYRFDNIDLLTLSACETAVGDFSNGREVEGFAALAQRQGAKSVIATLWPVDDESTGAFMQFLYKIHTENKGMTKGAALQATQQAFINARKIGQVNKYPTYYEHPYYWAPFIMMGNWL